MHVAEAGLFARLMLPNAVPASDVLAALRQRNVLAVPTSSCYMPAFPKDNGLRLSIIRTDERQIEAGLALIGQTVREQLARKPHLSRDPVVEWTV